MGNPLYGDAKAATLPAPMPAAMPWNWYAMGAGAIPNPTPPFRPPGGDVGPAPPRNSTPTPYPPGMETDRARFLRTGERDPNPYDDSAWPLYANEPSRPETMDDLAASAPDQKKAIAERKSPAAPKGKVFVDRIEDNGTAVLLDGSKRVNMRAKPGWREGMYVDMPKRRVAP